MSMNGLNVARRMNLHLKNEGIIKSENKLSTNEKEERQAEEQGIVMKKQFPISIAV